MSDHHRDAINPPKAIPPVPPVTEEAKRIAKGDYFTPIGETKPTWKEVIKDLFKRGK